jgi:hypothetical protein
MVGAMQKIESNSFQHSFQLVLTLEYLFSKYNIYDTGIVCSFFPTVVYWIKRQQPQILTGKDSID